MWQNIIHWSFKDLPHSENASMFSNMSAGESCYHYCRNQTIHVDIEHGHTSQYGALSHTITETSLCNLSVIAHGFVLFRFKHHYSSQYEPANDTPKRHASLKCENVKINHG